MKEQTVNGCLHWRGRLRAMGPGIMMASAAVGGSHIIASTQAGALYGWQLALIIVLANLFKYPFFRFGPQYTLETGKSLLEGYAEKSRVYLWVFFVLNLCATVINTAAVSMLCAAILSFVLPGEWSMNALSAAVLASAVLLLLVGPYRTVDGMSKIIMVSLTLTTVAAVAVAAGKGAQMQPGFIEPSPWNLGALAFIVALMGWMPAPIEISAINSMWVSAKRKLEKVSYEDGLFDFNVGYISTAVLAVVFLALGALVQYGTGTEVKMAGGAYIGQLIDMYAQTIGEWSRWLVAFIAFACMYGTTITVIDGYSRTNMESLRLILRHPQRERSNRILAVWIIFAAASGLCVMLFFKGAVLAMLKFAMIASFVSTPVFAYLNLALVRKGKHRLQPWLMWLAWIGLLYLSGFTVLFLLNQSGMIA
ncbi:MULTISPECIES: NRAMP family divalent metal transporter [unclassified Neisseria]|uniref:NRAMP family divalent metal transporter n=1 Tax=unclassified Neisseria TaxID=2623750 RepID=UPI001072B0AF|nr:MULTISPECIES: NRAMP family divalent metal transporter [unclassified Neisseria]MBF0804601.1 divalent metal cation transporter [Neisseria sp. 19428wB4_WF04]TFU40391.1 divalent metal cation transporter [Neisseria sp. WF04]